MTECTCQACKIPDASGPCNYGGCTNRRVISGGYCREHQYQRQCKGTVYKDGRLVRCQADAIEQIRGYYACREHYEQLFHGDMECDNHACGKKAQYYEAGHIRCEDHTNCIAGRYRLVPVGWKDIHELSRVRE